MKRLHLFCKQEWFGLHSEKRANITGALSYFINQITNDDSDTIILVKAIAVTMTKTFPIVLHYKDKDNKSKFPITIKNMDELMTHILYISGGYWYLTEKETKFVENSITKSEDFIKKENSKFKF